MTRKEMYTFLKENNLTEKVKEQYGKNYTLVSNFNLEQFIKDNTKKTVKEEIQKAVKSITKKDVKDCCKGLKKDIQAFDGRWMALKFKKLVTLLKQKELISKKDVEKLFQH